MALTRVSRSPPVHGSAEIFFLPEGTQHEAGLPHRGEEALLPKRNGRASEALLGDAISGHRQQEIRRAVVEVSGGRVRPGEPRQRPAEPPQGLREIQRRGHSARDLQEHLGLPEPVHRLRLQAGIVALELPPLEHPGDERAEAREVHGLHHVPGRAPLHGRHRRVERRVAGDDQDVHRRRNPLRLLHDGDPVDVGKEQVHQVVLGEPVAMIAETVARRGQAGEIKSPATRDPPRIALPAPAPSPVPGSSRRAGPWRSAPPCRGCPASCPEARSEILRTPSCPPSRAP